MKSYTTILTFLAFLVSVTSFAQKTDQQITFGSIPQKTYGDEPFNISATASSGLAVTFTSSNTQVAVVNENVITITGAGTTTITANQSGDDNFNPALPVPQVLVVVKADQTITFDELAARTFGAMPFQVSATTTSGLGVSYVSSDPNVATLAGSIVIVNGAGTCTITATQPGNSNYNAAPSVGRVLLVNKAPQTIFFGSLTSKTYGDAPFSLSGTTTSGLSVTYSSNSSLVSIDNNVVTILGAGDVEIIASQPGSDNYLAAEPVVQTLTIKKAPQTIAFDIVPVKTYGDPPFTLSAQASSGLPVNFFTPDEAFLTIDGTVATIEGAGTAKIFVSQGGNENYLPVVVEQSITINKASQTITFEPLAAKKFGDSPFEVLASSSSGLPITFTSSKKTVAKVIGNVVTIFGAGTTSVVASQAGNANYLPAPNVTQTLEVSSLGNSYPILGITRNGGNGRGTVFNVNTNGTGHTLQKNFSPNAYNGPQGGLTKGTDGKLYGMIMAAGSPANGVVFSINTEGSEYTVLHNFSFTDGQRPFGNVMEASNGYLYGMTWSGGVNNAGVVFRIKKDGTEFSRLYEFSASGDDGYHPLGGLLEAADGDLYGMTAEGGTGGYGVIFKIKKDGSGYTRLLNLNGTTSGGYPRGDLIQGPDGYLYGSTSQGGSSNKGVVFKVKTDGTDYQNLINFNGTSNGSMPGASLILGGDGKLYGTTQAGGAYDNGVIFSVNTDGTLFNKLLDLDGSNTGAFASGSLLQSVDGYLYGLTGKGGVSNLGVAFRIKPDGTEFLKLMDFNGTNGATPVFGALLEVQPGRFVSMTSRGGPSDSGIIFSVDTNGSATTLKDFPQPEGTPEVISSANGEHYFGIASSGGPEGYGVIFKTSANGGDYEKLRDLPGNPQFVNKLIHTSDNQLWAAGTEGVFTTTGVTFRLNDDGTNFERVEFDAAPDLTVSYLIEGPGQYIYGAGQLSDSPNGIIFRCKTDGTNFVKLADIPGGSAGSRPTGNLVISEDGYLFGLTTEGGANNWGAVFKVNLTSGTYTRIFSLQSSETGSYPKRIILLNDGSLCVLTAVGGANSVGTIFSINTAGGDYFKIYDFHASTCSGPTDVIQTGDGYLIGSTEYGGANNHGVIFEILTDGSGFKKIFEFTGSNGSFPVQLAFRKAEQVITFDLPGIKQYNDPDIILTATNSSGLPIVYTSSDESIVSIQGNVATILNVGEVTITAKADGNVNFLPAQTQQSLTVNKDDQVITLELIADRVAGSAAFHVAATASSGLPVGISSSSNHISITGNQVTLLSAGQVTIEASQPGNALYAAAPDVTETFCINPAKPVITKSDVTSDAAVLNSSQSIGNQWYKDGILIPDATSASLAVSEDGVYTVITTIEGCASLPSAPHVLIITTAGESPLENYSLYPNPVQETAILKRSGNTTIEIQIYDIHGRQLIRLPSTQESEVVIDTKDLPFGIYFLKVTTDKNVTITRFAKQ